MLSYRHSFHAGNHADVLKHAVLVLITRYLLKKPKPLHVVDTHSGAGIFSLDHEQAQKNKEFETGISRLYQNVDLPIELNPYLDCVSALNSGEQLLLYPGSPWLFSRLLRENDRLDSFELHPTDAELFKKNFGQDRRIRLSQSDGFKGLKGLLPPPSRRGLVLIDPPYEVKTDYQQVIEALKDGLKRFATGTYLVWYPKLNHPAAKALPSKLKKLSAKWLCAELDVENPKAQGMWGSGMFVINPPWSLKQELTSLLPPLAERLARKQVLPHKLESSE